MATPFPYTLYACPCNDTTSVVPNSVHGKRGSRQEINNDDGEERTFNPHDPRANYALNPLENLLFCDECNIMRCSRCWTEEILYWYCPNCLFEVPSSGVKSDGNRCARHCYNCPLCTASLAITAVNRPADNTYLKPGDTSSTNESYILLCPHCDWSSLDIGIRLSKPTKITEQLNKLRKAKSTSTNGESDTEQTPENDDPNQMTHDDAFQRLTSFYKTQLSETSDQPNPFASSIGPGPGSNGSPYSSPANLARIMSLYGGLSYNALKKSRETKPRPMREALTLSEGLSTFTPPSSSSSTSDPDSQILHKLLLLGPESTTTSTQRLSSPLNFSSRFHDDLWPVATPLRAKRGKRCRSCRQFLARHDQKVGSTRYKIRLIALNYIQRISIKPLIPGGGVGVGLGSQIVHPSFNLKPEPLPPTLLPSGQTLQYVLTVRNPVFETVRVTLATPAITPGKVGSRVTILCPTFTVGPAGDVWDEALGNSAAVGGGRSGNGEGLIEGGRRAAMASLTGSADGSGGNNGPAGAGAGGGDRQPEAGKIWERSRNSTSVVLEVVPGIIAAMGEDAGNGVQGESGLDEDEDVLEIPIYIRAEWEAEPHADVAGGGAGGGGGSSSGTSTGLAAIGEKKVEKESKELAYWCVLGLGRIANA